jgi:hypothetical protein
VPPEERDQTKAIDLNREEMIMTQHERRWGCASLFVLIGWLLLSLLYLLGVPVYALESLVLYDDLNDAHIDPNRWSLVAGWGDASTEAIRKIQDQRLRLVYRSYAKTDSDSERLSHGEALFFPNPASITAIQATVQVTDAMATGCRGNPNSTRSWASLNGSFFNTATPTPGSSENDVVAFIRLARASDSTDPPDVLRVQSLVLHCKEKWNCDTTLHFQDLGLVKLGETYRLRVQWDRENHRFIFQRGGDPEIVAPYTVSDTAPASNSRKTLALSQVVANCTATPRPVAFMDASFDDVMVNASAAPRGGR